MVTAVKLRATMDVTSPTSAPPSFTLARSGRFQRVGDTSVERDAAGGVAAPVRMAEVGQSWDAHAELATAPAVKVSSAAARCQVAVLAMIIAAPSPQGVYHVNPEIGPKSSVFGAASQLPQTHHVADFDGLG